MCPLLLLKNSKQSRLTSPKPVVPYRVTRLGVVMLLFHIINVIMYHHTPFGLYKRPLSACQITGLSCIFRTKVSR